MSGYGVRRCAWFCLAFSGAILLCRYLLPSRLILWTAVLCALLCLTLRFFRNNITLRLRLAAAGAALGLVFFLGQERLIILPAEERVGEERSVSARVTDWPDVYEKSEYVTVRLTERGVPRVRCRVASYVTGELADLAPGDEVRLSLRFQSARLRSGEEIDTYTSQGIFLRGVCTDAPERTGRWRFAFLAAPRYAARWLQQSAQRLFPAGERSFMIALLTGEKGPLYADGDRYLLLREAGLAHVVAVSGMHISFLLGFFFLLFGRRRGAVLTAMPLLLLFAAMTGFTLSVTRAVFMQLCLLSASLFYREEDTATSLSAALFILLALNPAAAGSVSLQLSFASVAGIWLVSQRLYRAMTGWIDARPELKARLLHRLLFLLAGNLSSSFGALLFTVPLTAVHFGEVSTASPLSNALCLWMVSLLYIGGYLTLGLGAVFPPVGHGMGAVLAWGVRYVYGVGRLLVRLPCASVYVTNPLFALWLVSVYVLFFIAYLRGRREGHFRFIVPACLSVIGLYSCAFAVYFSWSDEVRLTALNVGQGQSIVLTSGEHTVMVDCGGSTFPTDAGETAARFLGGQRRLHMDALILTHLHSDHVNGAAALLRQFKTDVLYLPAEADRDGYLPEILSAAREKGTAVEYVTENLLIKLGDLECTVFAPMLPGGENENCLIVLATQGEFDALITGDSPAASEELLISRYALPDIEVLVAGHHGSKTSTCRRLLERLRPDAAIISVGYNTYGHPSAEVLSRLADDSIPVYRTDREGNITIKAQGGAA